MIPICSPLSGGHDPISGFVLPPVTLTCVGLPPGGRSPSSRLSCESPTVTNPARVLECEWCDLLELKLRLLSRVGAESSRVERRKRRKVVSKMGRRSGEQATRMMTPVSA